MNSPTSLKVIEPYRVLLGIIGVGIAGIVSGSLWLFLLVPALFILIGYGMHWVIYAMVEDR